MREHALEHVPEAAPCPAPAPPALHTRGMGDRKVYGPVSAADWRGMARCSHVCEMAHIGFRALAKGEQDG